MFFLDIILYKLLCLFCPDKEDTVENGGNAGENSANWVILDHFGRNKNSNQDNTQDNTQDTQNNNYEDYNDGPNW